MGNDYADQNLVIAGSTGSFVTPNNLGRAYRRCLGNVEVEKIRFHDLRHTHASMLFALKEHPKVVQERLGHSSIQVTMDKYSHMVPNMQEAAAASLESAFKKRTRKTRTRFRFNRLKDTNLAPLLLNAQNTQGMK
ncbi:tyrosine-type recombinase/integrase [Virgibacillus halophilus]|uniref:Tyrosine-type recombinase/integrase n=1 Tax=Tigheibacillus halophilus TaxID=361280 RepID=A0ABU5C7A7_9BACI|nr:tyrosine-type recombinase/integrase [Virgibacillus halophilus]